MSYSASTKVLSYKKKKLCKKAIREFSASAYRETHETHTIDLCYSLP